MYGLVSRKHPFVRSTLLRISTLGRLALDDESGPVGGAGNWRPTLATLALLASAGDQGLPRERVLSLLWPESAPDRARNNLKQLLFSLRRAVPNAVEGTATLRLDRARISCDLWELRGALASGDYEAAVAVYAGPFLDGFSFPGAVEFERWAEGERALLADEFHRALSTLAERSMAAGHHRTAVAQLRRLAAAEPLDSDVTLHLMLAMVASGNRAGALQQFDIHAALVRQELECEPDAAVIEYADTLRSHSRLSPPGGALVNAAGSLVAMPAPDRSRAPESRTAPALRLVSDDGPASAANFVAPSEPVPAASTTTADRTPPAEPRVRRLTHARRVAVGVTALALAVVAGTLGVARWRNAHTAPSADAPNAVAVMPFAVQGAPSIAYLGPGLADLLSASLDGAGRLRSVDSRVVLAATDDTRGRAVDPAAASSVARRFGARYFVLGSVVESGGRLRITAAMYDRGDRARPMATESVESSADSIFPAVDALAARLLVERFRTPGERLSRAAATTTTSIAALKEYLEGEVAFRSGEYASAAAAYERAIEVDSAFALAHYRLSQAADWSGRDERVLPAAERALHFAQRLSAQDSLLVRAFVDWRSGRLDDAERLYRAEVADHPDDVEGWYQLGALLFHGNPLRGRAATDARAAFERVLALDADNPDALVHLARIAFLQGRTAEVDSLMRRMLALAPSRDVVELRAFRAFALGDRQGQKRVTTELLTATERVSPVTALEVAMYADDLEGADRFGRALTERYRSRDVQGYGHRLLAHTAAARGQWRAAQLQLAAAAAFDSTAALEHRALFAALPFLPVSRAEIADVRAALERWRAADDDSPDAIHSKAHLGMHAALRLYLLGLLSARQGDTTATLDYVRRLERTADTALGGSVSAAARATFAHSLRARVADAAGQPALALAELDRAQWPRIASSFMDEALDRYYRADLLQRLGRLDEAKGWYRSIAQRATYELPYLAPSRLRLAQIAESQRDAADAARMYRGFLAVWRSPDPALAPVVREARERLARGRG